MISLEMSQCISRLPFYAGVCRLAPAYYAWKKRPGQLMSADVLYLYRRMKALFKQSRNNLGSRGMMKKLREEGIETGRHKVRNLMKKLNLKVTQRIAYKVTTKSKPGDKVAAHLLNQNFNPVALNQVWAGDIRHVINDS